MTLQARLSHEDCGVRRVAVLEFVDQGDEEDLPEIVRILSQDPEPQLRLEAAQALAGWDRTDTVAALAAALQDVPPVREAAAASLQEIKDPGLGVVLIPYARHADAFVVAAALRALKELRVVAAAEPALSALQHPDAPVRREAVGVLGWLKLGDALPRLARLVAEDPDTEVRRAVSGALGLAAPQNEVALAALKTGLRDSQWQVREEAATTLGKFNSDVGTNAVLREALEDEHWQVRLRAARSLGRRKDRLALPRLIEALVHPAGNLRKEAAIALGEIGDAQAVAALNVAAGDPDPEVRKAVRLALQRL
jgi:HEAT repeat protein